MSEALTFADVERVVQAMAGVGVFPPALPIPQKGGA